MLRKLIKNTRDTKHHEKIARLRRDIVRLKSKNNFLSTVIKDMKNFEWKNSMLDHIIDLLIRLRGSGSTTRILESATSEDYILAHPSYIYSLQKLTKAKVLDISNARTLLGISKHPVFIDTSIIYALKENLQSLQQKFNQYW